VYAGLALDPLGLRPWDIARLTDHQIDRLYRRPVAKRNEEMRNARPSGGSPGSDARGDDAAAGIKEQIAQGQAPSRAAMVSLLGMFGMPPKEASAEYERQLAVWNTQKREGDK
jgi:hypothetical protein